MVIYTEFVSKALPVAFIIAFLVVAGLGITYFGISSKQLPGLTTKNAYKRALELYRQYPGFMRDSVSSSARGIVREASLSRLVLERDGKTMEIRDEDATDSPPSVFLSGDEIPPGERTPPKRGFSEIQVGDEVSVSFRITQTDGISITTVIIQR